MNDDTKMKTNKKNDAVAEDATMTTVATTTEDHKDNKEIVDCEVGGAGVASSSCSCDTVASAPTASACASTTASIEKSKTGGHDAAFATTAAATATATAAPSDPSAANSKENEKNSKKKIKAAASRNDTSFLDSIQDMPSVNDAQSNLYEGPGAHAVPGRPSNSDVAQQPGSPLHLNNDSIRIGGNDDDDEDHLINEAVIVVEEEETSSGGQDTSNPSGTVGVSTATTAKTNELVIEVDKVIKDNSDNIDKKKTHEQQQRGATKLQWILLVLAIILAVTFLLIAFLVIFPSDDNNSNENDEVSSLPGDNHNLNPNNNDNNILPENEYVIPFQEDLIPIYIEDIQTIGSPANLANQWMMQDPYLESYSPERQRQRFTLAALYYNLGGPHWYNSHYWLSYEISECYWYSTSLVNYGINVCDDDNNVISVSLSSNNLMGTFPLYFSHLPNLRVFDLEDNNIHGIIPALYTSSYLEVFAVAHNELEGQLIGKGGFAALDLKVARVNDNRFTGSLIVFQWLAKLEYVNVTSNRFNGMIPPQLQECQHLTYLGLGHNLYQGPIPSQLGLLSNLYEIDVSGNPMVDGTVPEELANLTNLIKLDISNTSIEGSIPQELCTKQEEDNLEIVANCNSTNGLVQCCHTDQ